MKGQYKALKDNSRYDRFLVQLAGPCHCGENHVVSPERNGWDLLLRVKACLAIVNDVNVGFREAAAYSFGAALEKLRVEAEEKLRKM